MRTCVGFFVAAQGAHCDELAGRAWNFQAGPFVLWDCLSVLGRDPSSWRCRNTGLTEFTSSRSEFEHYLSRIRGFRGKCHKDSTRCPATCLMTDAGKGVIPVRS